MANASHKHIGVGSGGKHSGTGAMTDMPEGALPENMILSNRDKQLHPEGRGLDSKRIQTDQLREHAANQNPPDDE